MKVYIVVDRGEKIDIEDAVYAVFDSNDKAQEFIDNHYSARIRKALVIISKDINVE